MEFIFIARGVDCIDADFKLFAKIGSFPIADIIGSRNCAIIRFSNRIIAAVFTGMKIGIAMGAHSAETDLHI